MTEGGDDSVDWNNPLPGNVHALTGEIERLENVRDQCYDVARVLRGLGFDNWTGSAYTAFDDFRRTRLVRQWEEVGDAHDGAVLTLAEYRDMLATLQPLAKNATQRVHYDLTYAQADATADILRWREQVAAAARKTAVMLREVADQLRALRPPLTGDQPSEVCRSATDARLREPAAVRTAGTNKVTSFGRHQSPAVLHDEVILLCDALLEAEFVGEDEL